MGSSPAKTSTSNQAPSDNLLKQAHANLTKSKTQRELFSSTESMQKETNQVDAADLIDDQIQIFRDAMGRSDSKDLKKALHLQEDNKGVAGNNTSQNTVTSRKSALEKAFPDVPEDSTSNYTNFSTEELCYIADLPNAKLPISELQKALAEATESIQLSLSSIQSTLTLSNLFPDALGRYNECKAEFINLSAAIGSLVLFIELDLGKNATTEIADEINGTVARLNEVTRNLAKRLDYCELPKAKQTPSQELLHQMTDAKEDFEALAEQCRKKLALQIQTIYRNAKTILKNLNAHADKAIKATIPTIEETIDQINAKTEGRNNIAVACLLSHLTDLKRQASYVSKLKQQHTLTEVSSKTCSAFALCHLKPNEQISDPIEASACALYRYKKMQMVLDALPNCDQLKKSFEEHTKKHIEYSTTNADIESIQQLKLTCDEYEELAITHAQQAYKIPDIQTDEESSFTANTPQPFNKKIDQLLLSLAKEKQPSVESVVNSFKEKLSKKIQSQMKALFAQYEKIREISGRSGRPDDETTKALAHYNDILKVFKHTDSNVLLVQSFKSITKPLISDDWTVTDTSKLSAFCDASEILIADELIKRLITNLKDPDLISDKLRQFHEKTSNLTRELRKQCIAGHCLEPIHEEDEERDPQLDIEDPFVNIPSESSIVDEPRTPRANDDSAQTSHETLASIKRTTLQNAPKKARRNNNQERKDCTQAALESQQEWGKGNAPKKTPKEIKRLLGPQLFHRGRIRKRLEKLKVKSYVNNTDAVSDMLNLLQMYQVYITNRRAKKFGLFFGYHRDCKIQAVAVLLNALDHTTQRTNVEMLLAATSDAKLPPAAKQGLLGEIASFCQKKLKQYSSEQTPQPQLCH